MTENFHGSESYTLTQTKITASCPSNIALIKYWGKYKDQIPANPSISYTLQHCKTNTTVEFFPDAAFSVETFLAGEKELKFGQKIEKYFQNISSYLPWILKGKYTIHTENTFPHSSGIASSASGFGALAKVLMEMDAVFTNISENADFRLKKTSFLARLGSGSASRSLYNGLIVWGDTAVVENSSDLYAVPYPDAEIHPVFKNFNDWVLLIHEGEKKVSSTLGHALMDNHAYAEKRFQEAHENFIILKDILAVGDLKRFITLVEHEALTLHAMMMMSNPAFILMKSGTLEVINRIWQFRQETGLPVFFTLDAGANVHVLFPEDGDSSVIKSFISEELLPFAQNGKMVKDQMSF